MPNVVKVGICGVCDFQRVTWRPCSIWRRKAVWLVSIILINSYNFTRLNVKNIISIILGVARTQRDTLHNKI